MDIFNESQPEFIKITEQLLLHKFNKIATIALEWYQDESILRLVDGPGRKPYDQATLERMYHYLDQHGELYYIEWKKENYFKPIGDVTLEPCDLPIVIGLSEFRGKGIGFQVVQALIRRAKALGLPELSVREIYNYNIGSQKLFTKCGFKEDQRTKLGHSYKLIL